MPNVDNKGEQRLPHRASDVKLGTASRCQHWVSFRVNHVHLTSAAVICAVMAFVAATGSFALAEPPDHCVDEPARDPAVRINACSDFLKDGGRSQEEMAAGLIQRGHAYGAVGSLDLAANDYNKAIALAPNQPGGYAGRALIAFAAGQAEAALGDLDRAIQLSPSDPTLYISRSAVYMAIGEPTKAVSDLDRSISLTPPADVSARIYLERGRANSAAGRTKEAISDFTMVIDSTGYSRSAFLGRALSFESTSEFLEAISDYTSILEMEPKDFELYFRRGNVYMIIGDDVSAFGDFTQSISLSPNFPPPYLFRGIIQGRRGDFQSAINDLTRSLALGENAEAYLTRAAVYAELGRFSEANADIDRSVQLKPGSSDAIQLRQAVQRALTGSD